ncbi:hypothetical protein [Heliophilum fasciatum]|uniref:Uncharacterized protein n=1 Tax=Heliophilum fasciatum TaxID=35700 RepID=A0A4R2RBH1_9FIRM|nr:hypothetical protein [Heliophilum fasciatum]MCW2279481.1 hypothetical protein [Heliophilum fasciatum]TCP59694.1 hypothetical protein EDD73_1514 [Heliophilum fasciatum]
MKAEMLMFYRKINRKKREAGITYDQMLGYERSNQKREAKEKEAAKAKPLIIPLKKGEKEPDGLTLIRLGYQMAEEARRMDK